MMLAMFKKAWDHRLIQGKALSKTIQRDLVKLNTEIESLLDRIVDATSLSVIVAYEKRIATLEK